MDFLSGNEAIVRGAINAGVKFFAGYPITPASTIMEKWVEKTQENKKLFFLQSEDEIAAIHHIIGSVLAGVPAFTATSGPGFSLMQEGLGLAFTYGAPIVVVNVMRSGPSTGKPTRAGQGEILSSKFGTHGDIMPFVIYPTSVEECYHYTVKAFEIAWKHRIPVIVLSDAYLASLKENGRWLMDNGWNKNRIFSTISYQSLTISHFTGLTDRIKNSGKIEEIKRISSNDYRFFNLWGNEKSDTLLIGLGSIARALRAFENEYQIFAPIRIWPFLTEDIIKIAKNKKRIVVVEMNEGQYLGEVERTLKRKIEFVDWKEETINLGKLKFLISN